MDFITLLIEQTNFWVYIDLNECSSCFVSHVFLISCAVMLLGEFLRKEHGEDLWQMPPILGSETVIDGGKLWRMELTKPHFSKRIRSKTQQRKGDYSTSHFVGIIIFMQFFVGFDMNISVHLPTTRFAGKRWSSLKMNASSLRGGSFSHGSLEVKNPVRLSIKPLGHRIIFPKKKCWKVEPMVHPCMV